MKTRFERIEPRKLRRKTAVNYNRLMMASKRLQGMFPALRKGVGGEESSFKDISNSLNFLAMF